MKTPSRQRVKNLVVAVRASVDSMTWLEPSDKAAVEIAVKFAEAIEDAVESERAIRKSMLEVLADPAATPEDKVAASQRVLEADAAVSKAVGWIGPQLVGALKVLGGSPAERKALKGGGSVGGRLAHLRLARQGDASSLDAASS